MNFAGNKLISVGFQCWHISVNKFSFLFNEYNIWDEICLVIHEVVKVKFLFALYDIVCHDQFTKKNWLMWIFLIYFILKNNVHR